MQNEDGDGQGQVGRKKKLKKSSPLVIQIEKGKRDAFVKRCDALETTAACEIRRFLREWVGQHAPTAESAVAAEAPVEPDVARTDPRPKATTDASARPARRKRKPIDAPAA